MLCKLMLNIIVDRIFRNAILWQWSEVEGLVSVRRPPETSYILEVNFSLQNYFKRCGTISAVRWH
jgi:hypothetical protein